MGERGGMVRSFYKYLQYEKRVSAHTLLSYQTDLNQFSSYLESVFEEKKSEHANYGMIRSWIVALMGLGMDPRSINRKIACLRTYYKFLLKQEVIDKNPMTKIKILKTKKKLPHFVKENDMITLLDNGLFEPSHNGFRDRLILELLYGTGIRLSELINLNDTDIDFRGKTIKVLGKRNKERLIPFTESLVLIIKEYIKVRNKEFEKDNCKNLLRTNKGAMLYPALVQKTVKKYLNLFSTVDKKSPHVLRHSYATHLLNKGAEINAVKDLLGHSNLSATQVYTHNSVEKLKKAFDQAHPKA